MKTARVGLEDGLRLKSKVNQGMSVSRAYAREGMMAAMLETPASTATAEGVLISKAQLERLHGELKLARAQVASLKFEVARLKRWRFGSSKESLDTQAQQPLFAALAQDTALEDRAAAQALQPEPTTSAAAQPKRQAVRQALPEALPRTEHRYELQQPQCECGQALERVGQEVSEQLDCVPAQFFVHRHIRGKYACRCCQTIQAAPLPAQIIDKGIPAPGLLAQVIVAKIDDHLLLYRQTEIYARSGVHIPRSSMAQWVGICGVRLAPLADALRDHVLSHRVIHVDETPIRLLAPGRGKTSKAYSWVYRTTDFAAQRAVWFDFCPNRSGEHPRRVLAHFQGTLLTDDYAGYDRLHAQAHITEAGCMAHARRKFFEAHKLNASPIAEQAVELIAQLYALERESQGLSPPQRLALRQSQAKPIADALQRWLLQQRPLLANADITAKAIDYSLRRWTALTHYLQDPQVPIDNNPVENAIRPIALGRKNWLFVGSQRAGERSANLMSLIESAKLVGHDPWAYLKDVLERLPTTLQRDLHSLLPHNWQPSTPAATAPNFEPNSIA